ncbi:MAG TPA: response regulator transcription factor [Terracidiphilus sp.]|jgi:two-component system, NarL family, nitrate/nitrite response regulator NarL|nr:response regulator transcription factor [Terracidiphilus sp.]
MHEIRILMVDDHSLFRESLSRLLQTSSGFEVVGECTSVAEALATLARTEVDVVLLDYDLGAEQGTGLLTEMKQQRQITAKVLLVTAGMSDTATRMVLENGASGIFLKHSSLDQLLSAIQRVAHGEIWLDAKVMRTLFPARNGVAESHIDGMERARPLTARQGEVMRGVLDGLTNKEIALNLKVSESSVKAVIQELFQKAGVRTRSQLVRIAIEKHSSDWLRQ